jgi:hypothetical protein
LVLIPIEEVPLVKLIASFASIPALPFNLALKTTPRPKVAESGT